MPGALVTGAGGGLGLAIARRLAHRGYDVTLGDINEAGVEQGAEQLGDRARALLLDVTDLEACRAAAAEVADRAGSLDIWVNNAGILITGVVYDQDPAAHRTMLDVNAIGTFNGTIAALEVMRQQGRGHIVNVISLAGIVAAPGEVAYSASKHAAIAFTIGTLADLRRLGIKGIDLSAVCPSAIWSPMLEDKLEDPDAAASFSGTMYTPDQVADRIESVFDSPRPVLTIPRWRGAMMRVFDAFPRLTMRLLPLVMADARRRQARFKQKVESGQWPPRA
jgi:NAD(P)-dependent dehydrogenase (short-subunit alcohol dehydrogenase family)